MVPSEKRSMEYMAHFNVPRRNVQYSETNTKRNFD